jgi:O-glycosyl hydrolase
MRFYQCMSAFLVVVLACSKLFAQSIHADAHGIARFVSDGYRELPLQASVLVFQDEWRKNTGQWTLKDRSFSRTSTSTDETLTLTGHFDLHGKRIEFRQSTVTLNADESTTVNYEFMSPTGVYNASSITLSFDLSSEFYGDWTIALDELPGMVRPTQLDKPTLTQKVDTRRAVLTSPDGVRSLEFVFGPASNVAVQDARKWGGTDINVMVTLHAGAVPANTPITFSYRAIAKVPADASPAKIAVDMSKPQQAFDGLGGNFVYAFDHPITQLNLDTLKLTWARAGMEMNAWAPSPDNIGAKNDTPGSLLRKRFELDQKLMRASNGRLIMSIWRAPEWIYDTQVPLEVWREHPSPISRDNWKQFATVIGSYLSHLKDRYGVEPALFSFNENDMGVYVKLSPEDHQFVMKLLGEEFAKRGLKTKQLAGDSAMLRDGIQQIQLTLNDPAAMKFVGALAHHPWATEQEYWDDWFAAAKQANLPLFATEMGADAGGYRDNSFSLPRNTFALARKYIDLIAQGGATALLEWEWTNDYPTYNTIDGKWVASRRHAVLWQLSQLSPQFAQVISTTSTRDDTPAVVIRKDDQLTLHVLNQKEARSVTVQGLPADLKQLHLTITTANESATHRGTVNLTDGQFTFEAPTQSLVSFTTFAPPAYKTGVE